ncbi:MAG TPA: phosphate ABC transporter permease PstA, partial [Planctomycetota bacterium]|nr:phosphate ABC transporter permease PstA [Planctomycetota bacterium]
DESKIVARETPPDVVLVERREWGNLYGTIKEVRVEGKTITQGPEKGLEAVLVRLPLARAQAGRIETLEKGEIGEVNRAQEKIRLQLRGLELQGVTSGPAVDKLNAETERLKGDYGRLAGILADLRKSKTGTVLFGIEGGKEKELAIENIVRIIEPNRMGFFPKLGCYLSRVWEFLSDEPRESNTEGGVFPAIFGTVMMVLLMSLFVTPLGILAALYLREYAKQGAFVSLVRIAVNNLAGVPSIVFGVFGMGFFIYRIGGSIDQLFFPESLPTPTFGTGGILWASLTLALMTVPVVIVATEEGLAAIPKNLREGSLALGATKWETTWRVILPALAPSILTGLILAIARAAGEVAPLMITGVVKLAPSLPLDGQFPFLHMDRKFMHLGFHIYDVGFQSPNVDAARPMVFTTTLLLLLIVVTLNLAAIILRRRLRKKFQMSAV